MNKTILAAASLAALLSSLPTAASAATVDDCKTDIAITQTGLDDAFNSGMFYSRKAQKDYDGLSTKLRYASQKLDRGKYGDAITKLYDFNAKVDSLISSAKQKLDSNAGYQLIQDANTAIVCIQSL